MRWKIQGRKVLLSESEAEGEVCAPKLKDSQNNQIQIQIEIGKNKFTSYVLKFQLLITI